MRKRPRRNAARDRSVDMPKAARDFAQIELADHKYMVVLHDHQANLHVHISVRTESKHGKRLNPRKVDLHRWRESFAKKLRGYGVEAEATRGRTREIRPAVAQEGQGRRSAADEPADDEAECQHGGHSRGGGRSMAGDRAGSGSVVR